MIVRRFRRCIGLRCLVCDQARESGVSGGNIADAALEFIAVVLSLPLAMPVRLHKG